MRSDISRAQTTRRRGDRRRGSAMLETALVFMVLICAIMFTMEMGRLLLFQQYFTERARAGVRAAVVNNWDSTTAANFVCYNSTTAPSGNPAGFLGVTPSQVTLTKLGTSTAPDYRFQIKISGIPMFTWIPYMSGRYTAAPAIATMPVQSLGATN